MYKVGILAQGKMSHICRVDTVYIHVLLCVFLYSRALIVEVHKTIISIRIHTCIQHNITSTLVS